MDLQQLIRKNIQALKPYSSARDEYTGEAMVFLDANENPFNAPYNRYPDPLQRELKVAISKQKSCEADQIFLGNGSDEPIDLLFRAFCEPGKDNIVTIDPTYGMYQVAADINNIEVRKVKLNDNYGFSAEALLEKTDKHTKLIFVCSPNNPTGNLLDNKELIKLIQTFEGLVILDEAYIDFAPGASLLPKLSHYENLVILQTFSKAWGMAGIRLGMAFANPEIIRVFNKIKYPYNINMLTQQKALELIEQEADKNQWVELLIQERKALEEKLSKLPFVVKVFPSDANFLLVKMYDARGIYDFLVENGIIVRDRSKVVLCDDSLRITVGSPEENQILLDKLNELL
ncbi:histidinol-phosphate transaminase [Sunxiuqinia elliptica]|uniref:Histidinol-phosphate aminotransferase n=1 Tax=Sunxiuqinia elliptica TaxID=655355 RepID=A0A1I2FEP2_9BACT|nr:histidinol-phosphate transaminase [Sunxiuqinia elliptica]SFF03725.1 histidinol-phosphate aminotransferase [Sunxiuqinia elliptica]